MAKEKARRAALTKIQLRKKFLALRDQLTPVARARASAIIRHRLFGQAAWRQASTVLIYVSFRSEVETLKLIQGALEQKKRVQCSLALLSLRWPISLIVTVLDQHFHCPSYSWKQIDCFLYILRGLRFVRILVLRLPGEYHDL